MRKHGEQGLLLIVEELVEREFIDRYGTTAVVEYGDALLSDTRFGFVSGNLEQGPGGAFVYTMELTTSDAMLNVYNFIWGRIAFQAIYVTPLDRSEELEDLVDYLLRTFEVN